jgi:hypothetical protein
MFQFPNATLQKMHLLAVRKYRSVKTYTTTCVRNAGTEGIMENSQIPIAVQRLYSRQDAKAKPSSRKKLH